MKKLYIMSIVGVASASAIFCGIRFFQKNRQKKQTVEDTVKEAGMPDQSRDMDAAQTENAKMVSEGSQFGVQYFNDVANMPEKN